MYAAQSEILGFIVYTKIALGFQKKKKRWVESIKKSGTSFLNNLFPFFC